MATITHYIRSEYDTDDVEQLQRGPFLSDAEAEEADPWLSERPFRVSTRVAKPPIFVAAKIGYSDCSPGSSYVEPGKAAPLKSSDIEGSVAAWYRSLERKTPNTGATPSTPWPPMGPLAGKSSTSEPREERLERRSRSAWFISRALGRSKSTGCSVALSSTSLEGASTPMLADILQRDPPPLPSEPSYSPPVWLSIGPGNKGFEMLQRKGWVEGEALGKTFRSRSGLGFQEKSKNDAQKTKAADENPACFISQAANCSMPLCNSAPREQTACTDELPNLDHGPLALVTPLPTVLKSDRLGIGLKAKTVGSGLYREPIKRVTHSQAALERHIRANEALQRLKMTVGRGRRGFDRLRKKEEESRKNMLAYLKKD